MTSLVTVLFLSTVALATSEYVNVKVAKAEPISVLELILNSGKPGYHFILPKSVYPGPIIVTANGTADQPMVLKGSSKKALILGNRKAPALTIAGNHWRLHGFNISNPEHIGLLITGNDVSATNLFIRKTAIGVKVTGKNVRLTNSTVLGTNTGVLIDEAEETVVIGYKIKDAGTCIRVTKQSQNGDIDNTQCNDQVNRTTMKYTAYY